MADSNKRFGADEQIDVIPRSANYIQESFDLNRLDDFVAGLGVEYLHYKAMPSPIGKKDRGDYRRSDGTDTITSNGMVYKCAGKFRGAMTDNSRQKKTGGAGTLDPAEGLLVMPRFYEPAGQPCEPGAHGDRIYLMPGDRLYIADPTVDNLVSNAHSMDYEPTNDNVPMFPIVRLELPILDSQNEEFIENIDYSITKEGNVRWIAGGRNPGIDPQTGKGRIYSVRYLYKSYWYVAKLLKEVRITNVTEDGERKPERAAYHPLVQREYLYHNQNRGAATNQLLPKDPKRTVQEPEEAVNPSKYTVPVDMSSIKDDEEQS